MEGFQVIAEEEPICGQTAVGATGQLPANRSRSLPADDALLICNLCSITTKISKLYRFMNRYVGRLAIDAQSAFLTGRPFEQLEVTPRCPRWVKLRNTQHEQMYSALPPRTDVGLARPTSRFADPLLWNVSRSGRPLFPRKQAQIEKRRTSKKCRQKQKSASLCFLPPWRAIERKAKRLRLTLDCPIQSGNPSFRRFSAIRFRTAGEKTIACLNFETVRSG
jgi:hypothetical protein